MPCNRAPGTGPTINNHFTNWAHNVNATPRTFFQPENLDELVAIVKQAAENNLTVRAVGSGWSFTDVMVSQDFMVDTSRLDRTLSETMTGTTYDDPVFNSLTAMAKKRNLYHVEAGVKIHHFYPRLESTQGTPGNPVGILLNDGPGGTPQRHGFAFHTLGGSGGQSIAGAVSTSVHGGDDHNNKTHEPIGPLPEMVQAIHLVGPAGVEFFIQRGGARAIVDVATLKQQMPCVAGPGQVISDDAIFQAAVVSVCRMGIIYSVVLDVRPQYFLNQVAGPNTWEAVSKKVLLTQHNPIGTPSTIADMRVLNRFLEVVILPYPNSDGSHTCAASTRNEVDPSGPGNSSGGVNLFNFACDQAPEVLDALVGALIGGLGAVVAAAIATSAAAAASAEAATATAAATAAGLANAAAATADAVAAAAVGGSGLLSFIPVIGPILAGATATAAVTAAAAADAAAATADAASVIAATAATTAAASAVAAAGTAAAAASAAASAVAGLAAPLIPVVGTFLAGVSAVDAPVLIQQLTPLLSPSATIGDFLAAFENLASQLGFFDVAAAAVNFVLSTNLPSGNVTDISYKIMDTYDYHSKCFKALSLEVAFDADKTEYVEYINDVFAKIDGLAAQKILVAAYISLRYCGGSKALLAIERWNHTVTIEIGALEGIRDEFGVLTTFEMMAAQRGATVHWGQLNSLTQIQVESAFPNMDKWRAALLRIGAKGSLHTFDNLFCQSHGLEILETKIKRNLSFLEPLLLDDRAANKDLSFLLPTLLSN